MIDKYDHQSGAGGWQIVNWLAVAISALFILLTQINPVTDNHKAWTPGWCSAPAPQSDSPNLTRDLASREQRDQLCALHASRF